MASFLVHFVFFGGGAHISGSASSLGMIFLQNCTQLQKYPFCCFYGLGSNSKWVECHVFNFSLRSVSLGNIV